ncbi:MAG: excinuclease ABC subunit A, partial [Rhodospirillales bacterium]|nr:excinuclease ABC subunit A [Rhodospirillales bacterium]
MGACPSCDGLGVTQVFDPARVVGHPELPLSAGAVRGWDRRNAHYFQLILSLAAHYGFDVDTPWLELKPEVQQAVLYGSGTRKIAFRYLTERGGKVIREHPFEGILPNLERRYQETESSAVREELAKYISDQPCPACEGQRLNRSARNVFVADHALPSLTHRSIDDTLAFFATLQLAGWRGEI